METMKRFQNILSVDDDFPTNLYTQLVLKESNMAENIIIKSSAKQVLSYLFEEENPMPEIFLMDLHMPLMDGWELLEAIEKKNDARIKDMKIFMLTSSAIVDDLDRAKNHSLINGILMKPLEPTKLLEQL